MTHSAAHLRLSLRPVRHSFGIRQELPLWFVFAKTFAFMCEWSGRNRTWLVKQHKELDFCLTAYLQILAFAMRSRPDSTQAPIPLFTPEPDKPQANVQVRRARPDSTLAPIPVRTDRPYSTLAPIPIDELYEEPRQEIFRHEDGVHVDDPPPYAYELEELTGSASQSGETGVTC